MSVFVPIILLCLMNQPCQEVEGLSGFRFQTQEACESLSSEIASNYLHHLQETRQTGMVASGCTEETL